MTVVSIHFPNKSTHLFKTTEYDIMFKLLFLIQIFTTIYISVYAYFPQHKNRIRLGKDLLKLNMFGSNNDPTSAPPPPPTTTTSLNDENKKPDIDLNTINKNKDSILPVPTGFDLSSISTILIYGYLVYLFLDTIVILVTGKSFDFSQYGKLN